MFRLIIFVTHFYFLPAKMQITAVVGADYPTSAPVFSVIVHWNSERSALNDNNIQVVISP